MVNPLGGVEAKKSAPKRAVKKAVVKKKTAKKVAKKSTAKKSTAKKTVKKSAVRKKIASQVVIPPVPSVGGSRVNVSTTPSPAAPRTSARRGSRSGDRRARAML